MSNLNRRIDGPHKGPEPVVEFRIAELLRMLDRDDVDFRQFSAALAGNKRAAERILRTVQSIAFGRYRSIESLQHAVALIGLRRVRASLVQLRQHEQPSAATTDAEDSLT